jgi:outer membrane protein assembly factor BamB
MSHDITFIPDPSSVPPGEELVYREASSRAGGLYVLMQDSPPRASEARARFLRACYRYTVSRYLDSNRPAGAHTFLRECAGAFDAIARAVDTRLDDFEGLGLLVAVREPGRIHILCARGATARVRWRGVFVPLATPDVAGVAEMSLDTSRSQHDLFAQTLPETLALYRISAAADAGDARDLLLGGTTQDMAHAVDAAAQTPHGDRVVLDRISRTVLMLSVPAPSTHAGHSVERTSPRRPAISVPSARVLAVSATAVVIVALAVVGVNSWWSAPPRRAEVKPATHTALKETPVAPPVEKRVVEDVVEETQQAAEEAPRGFGLAWQQSYRAAVTSSPAVAGDAVVFGGRDGRVYAIARESGERQWAYTAQGGVGASPVVRGATVIAADYGGNVVRLRAGDGRVVWKRALREKIVSTPAVTNERVVVGTVNGRVYAISLDTGRVLWKFAARGAIRGAIAYAGETFLVPSHDGRLYAIAEETGARRWAVSMGGAVASSPASDGSTVVIGSARGDVVAFGLRSGKELWRYRAGGEVNSALALVDGKVYAGAGDRRLYCIDAEKGSLLWRFDTEGAILSRPYVGDGRVVVTSYDGAVYCIDAASGSLIDRYATDESIFSSPAVVEGRVFFGNNAGRFFCLDSPES